MATRSTINKMLENGDIVGVYCHWDGYLENNGEILKNHYNTENKIDELLAQGDISSLGKDLESSTFYMRDRNEKNCEMKTHKDIDSFKKYSQEYNYIWINNKWLYGYGDETNFKEF